MSGCKVGDLCTIDPYLPVSRARRRTGIGVSRAQQDGDPDKAGASRVPRPSLPVAALGGTRPAYRW